MINKRDVLTLKIPFPSISSGLAVKAHMYVCQNCIGNNYSFVKCQTKKPYMVGGGVLQNFVEEYPDIQRNPFKNVTIIDCDKLFVTFNVLYDDALKTTSRSNVCEDVMLKINRLLALNQHVSVALDENSLVAINPQVCFATKK